MALENQQGGTSFSIYSPLKRIGNLLAAVLYFFAAHLYDGLCCAVSNIFSYPVALFLMTAILFSASVALVLLHKMLRERFQWDVLGINRINDLAKTNDIAKHKIFTRLLRWTLSRSHWRIHVIGSFLIGPPVVTLLLEKKENWKSRLFYLSSGTLISVLAWVTIWSGVGKITWNQYVIPFIQIINGRWE